MSWYDFDEKEISKRDYLAKVKYDKIVCQRAKSLSDIVGNSLDDGVQYRIVTENSFNAIVILEYLLGRCDLVEVFIVVYRMNLQSVRRLMDVAKTTKISVIISSFFRENKKYERWCAELVDFARDNDNMDVVYAWNHAKICLLKTGLGEHIVFEGSGNLSDNARIEQYIIENNKDVYQFHREWISKIVENG